MTTRNHHTIGKVDSIAATLQVLIAVQLTMPAESVMADTPPEGQVVWQSKRSGRFEIWTMRADGSQKKQLTQDGGEYPWWSPDGQLIAYRDTDGRTRVMAADGSDDREVFEGTLWFWTTGGNKRGLVCGRGQTYYLVDPIEGTREVYFRESDFSSLAGTRDFEPLGVTPDGRYLLAFSDRYRHGYRGTNGTFGSASQGVGHNNAIALDFASPQDVFFIGYGCEPTAPPAGPFVYHVRGDKTHATAPDIYRMDMTQLKQRESGAGYQPEVELPDTDYGHTYFPRVSNDNRWMVYGATTGDHSHESADYEIFVRRLGSASGDRTRLTHHKAVDSWPALYVANAEARTPDTGVPTNDSSLGPASEPPPDAGAGVVDAAQPGEKQSSLSASQMVAQGSGCCAGPNRTDDGGPVVLLLLVISWAWALAAGRRQSQHGAQPSMGRWRSVQRRPATPPRPLRVFPPQCGFRTPAAVDRH